jgi:hypothetical protein
MTLDPLRLALTGLDERRPRHSATIHDEAQPEELMQYSGNHHDADDGNGQELEDPANHALHLGTRTLNLERRTGTPNTNREP